MTATDSTGTATSTTASTQGDQLILYPEEKPGTGWLFFAATILGLAGLMRIIDSLWAFRYDGVLPDSLQNAVFGDDLTTYAWVWLGVGIVLIVASLLIVPGRRSGAGWARGRRHRWPHGHDVDALLPGLVAHLRGGRRPGPLRPDPLRQPGGGAGSLAR